MRHVCTLGLALLVVACGGNKDAPAGAGSPDRASPAKVAAASPAAPAAALAPASFVQVDLSTVSALGKVSAVAPPGATVTADAPDTFGDKQVHGAVISAGDFRLHIWWSTIGGERTTIPLVAKLHDERAIYEEQGNDTTTLRYTITTGPSKVFGYLRAIHTTDDLTGQYGQLLCGTATPVPEAAALSSYAAACDRAQLAP